MMFSLAACGGDDDGGDDDPDPDPQPTWSGEEILYGGEGNSRRWTLVAPGPQYDDNFKPGAYVEFYDAPDSTNIETGEGPARKYCRGFINGNELEAWSVEPNGSYTDTLTNEESRTYPNLLRTYEPNDRGFPEYLTTYYDLEYIGQDSVLIQDARDNDPNIIGYLFIADDQ